MKVFVAIALLMLSISGYTQQANLPPEIEAAFKAKYKEVHLADFWIDKQMYYLDFTLKGGSFIAVFDQQGVWKETAETIPELDIPEALNKHIRANHPSARICFCEKVEAPEIQKYLRVTLMDTGNVALVIESDLEGKRIKVIESIF